MKGGNLEAELFSNLEVPSTKQFEQILWVDDTIPGIKYPNGFIYVGDLSPDGSLRNGFGKLYCKAGGEYIEGYWQNDHLQEVRFAQFNIHNSKSKSHVRIYGDDNLLCLDAHNYIAQIKINFTLIKEFSNFYELYKKLHSHIKIVKVLNDTFIVKLVEVRQCFIDFLNMCVENITVNAKVLKALYLLLHILHTCKTSNKNGVDDNFNDNMLILERIKNWQRTEYSKDLKEIVDSVLFVEKEYYMRNQKLPVRKHEENRDDEDIRSDYFSWKKKISFTIQKAVNIIREDILNSLSNAQNIFIPNLQYDIEKLALHQVFYLNKNDVKLFLDLELTTLQQIEKLPENLYRETREMFRCYIANIWRNYLSILQSAKIKNDEIKGDCLTKSVYLQLYKTFLELLLEILKIDKEIQLDEVVILDKSLNFVVNLSEGEELLNQFKFILKLLNHFKPPVTHAKSFKYDLKRFKEITNPEKSWYKIWKSSIKVTYDDMENIPEDYCVLIYYVHYSLNLFVEKKSSEELKEFYDEIITLLLSIVLDNTTKISLEQMRVLCISFIKFSSFAVDNFVGDDDDNTAIATKDLMAKQLLYLKQYIQNKSNIQESSNISDLIDALQVFWKHWSMYKKDFPKLFPVYTCDVFENYVIQFYENVCRVLCIAYDLNFYENKFLVWLRSFNELLKLLHSTNFPWYIKSDNSSQKYLSLVSKDYNSYLVLDASKYIKRCNNIPKHYLFEIVEELFSCVEKFLENLNKLSKRWSGISETLQCLSDFTYAIAKSFVNFNEQPYYEDFDSFCRACTKPFAHLLETALNSKLSINDFTVRISNLEHFYAYTKETTVMSIENALRLCSKLSVKELFSFFLDYKINTDKLLKCYNVYIAEFNDIISNYMNNSNRDIKKLVSKYKSSFKEKNIFEWNTKFKTENVPKILAVLSATWSILQSVDVIGQERIIKPHCIQILCILRLLSADKLSENGVKSHLSQVLTGQGKSVVLGLLAATLTVTGNRTRIVCYNKYLSDRDQEAFSTFFKLFQINGDIHYGNFRDMAEEALIVNNGEEKYDIRDCVRNFLLGNLKEQKLNEDNNEKLNTQNTILLVDEVDVFFSSDYYGNLYNPAVLISSEEIATLQVSIWNIVENASGNYGTLHAEIKSKIERDMRDLIYKVNTDSVFYKLYYKSKVIFDKHIDDMIKCAIELKFVYTSEKYWQRNIYKLNENNLIVYIDKGIYRTDLLNGYLNVFNYFRLKKTKFDHQNFENYGYLNVRCGQVSYALLPKEYPTILGVTGTLTTLTKPELKAVESYKINIGSVMPSFFGRRKLEFDTSKDVSIIETSEADWIKAIVMSVMRRVDEGRAVLVFFEEEQVINEEIREAFTSHVGRLHIFTGNESSHVMREIIDGAGVSRHVTVTTRYMGRGVDYKSNESFVEANGGIHVIQTFFSSDVKEEVQIQGRTARLDHRGSYELVLYRAHLEKSGFKASSSSPLSTYEDLCDMRGKKSIEEGEKMEKSIAESTDKHQKTMEFFKSLRNYQSSRRSELLSSYPFREM